MAGEWVTASLGELCDFRAGAVFRPDLQGRTSGEFPFVKVSDMNLPANAVHIQSANNWVSDADLRTLRAKPFPPGTVVFAKIGEALRQNRLRQISRETVVDNNMMGAVPRTDRIDARFFYYGLSRFDFSDIAQGTALPYLTVGSLSALTLDVPPPLEQRAIAHILGTLDDKIELNRRMNETLEDMACALFKSWFIDFEPVRAKAEGRDSGVPQAFSVLFPDSFLGSGLGEVPSGWGERTIDDACQLVTRGVTPSYENGTGRFIINQRVNRGARLDWSELKELAASCVVPPEKFAKPWDVLVNCLGEGTLGRVHLFQGESDVFAVDQHMSICRAESRATALYLHRVLASPWGQAKIESLKTGSTGMTMFNISKLREFTLLWPGMELVEAYFQAVEPMLIRLAANVQESETLVALRDTLLPKLLSGEVRVASGLQAPAGGE